MGFYVYMLKSKSVKPVTYVGYTNNLKKRINMHNIGKGAKFTRGRLWKIIYNDKDFMKFATEFRPLVLTQENKLMTAAPWTPYQNN